MTHGKHREERPVRRRRAVTVAAAAAGITLLGATSAVAYWSTTGTGQGAAAARSFVAPTVAAGQVTGPGLFPGLVANGSTAGATLAVSASNPNPFPVTVTVSQSGDATGCTTPDVSFTTSSFDLPASSGTVTRELEFTVGMGSNAGNDCQGKTITVPLTTASTSR